MATVESPMAHQVRPGLPNWRIDDTRNIRSNAKAERILGLSEISGPLEQSRKRLGFNFSFPDLRDVIPALSKKGSKHNFGFKASDSESIASNPSPTFDPSASTTSLNTIDSSPIANKRRPEQPLVISPTERLSQAETLKVSKANVPSEEERHQLKMLLSMGILNADTQPISLSRRKRSVASLTSFRSEATTKAYQPDSTPVETEIAVPPVPSIAAATTARNFSQQHARNRSEEVDSNTRPQRVPRSSSLPAQRVLKTVAVAMAQEPDQIIPIIEEDSKLAQTMPLQWPLPATRIPSPPKLRRINNSNLLAESVLLWSSDEDDSDAEKPRRRSFRSSARWSRQLNTNRTDKAGHQRQESNASSVIQLDSRPWIRPASSFPSRTFPKRSLADIAAAGASRPESCDSWETDVIGEFGLRSSVTDNRPSEDLEVCQTLQVATHPLWRASTSSGDIDISVPKSRTSVQMLPEDDTNKSPKAPEDDGVLDFSSFPVPPRSRAGSILPSIQVHNTDDDRTLVKTTKEYYPAIDGVLLSPSLNSRSSVDSHYSGSSGKNIRASVLSSQSISKQDAVIEKLRRKRTISNVPIYVTGLESSMNNDDAIDGDVKSYVFGSIF